MRKSAAKEKKDLFAKVVKLKSRNEELGDRIVKLEKENVELRDKSTP